VNISAEVAEAGAGLVHADTADGTTAALQQWLALAVGERRAMAERARGLFEERYEIKAAAAHFRQLLQQVAAN
jgi:glycosyltransferase involved in cell wall biosynthesis